MQELPETVIAATRNATRSREMRRPEERATHCGRSPRSRLQCGVRGFRTEVGPAEAFARLLAAELDPLPRRSIVPRRALARLPYGCRLRFRPAAGLRLQHVPR